MDQPTISEPRRLSGDVTVFGSYYPLPFYGILPVNCFLIHAEQPVLVDTGYLALREEFMSRLRSVMDPKDLRWLWLTHTDPDHMGNLLEVLDEAPDARIVTTFLGMGKMGVYGMPLDRVYLLNPGQSLDVGDRTLLALRPPTYDAPETTGFLDCSSRTLFSADSFGALIQEPYQDASQIPPTQLRDGLVTWATVDSPWLHIMDRDLFGNALDAVRGIAPETILSSHLLPALGMTDTLLGYMAEAPSAEPFIGPDQAALERAVKAA